MNDKFKDAFKNSVGFIAVFILCALYLCVSFITVSETGKSVANILADTAIAFVFGVCVNSIFELQGMLEGDKDPRMVETAKKHAEKITAISPYIEDLSSWCDNKNSEAVKIQRVRILAAAGLKYNSVFNEEGVSLPYEPAEYPEANNLTRWQAFNEILRRKKIESKRYRGYRTAINLSITPLTASVLTSEGGRSNDPFYLGRTKIEYERTQTFKSVFSRIATALIFGYYGASLIENFAWSSLIWTLLQVGTFLACGIISYYNAKIFVVDEYRGRICKKTENLQAFENFMLSKGGNKNDEQKTT